MPTLSAITFDCRDVTAQSQFWSHLLDRSVDDGANQFFASIGVNHDEPSPLPGLLFLLVDDQRVDAKNPVHLDLFDLDLPAAVAKAVGLGAVEVATYDEYGIEWVTLRDPEGNLFDIGRPSTSR